MTYVFQINGLKAFNTKVLVILKTDENISIKCLLEINLNKYNKYNNKLII